MVEIRANEFGVVVNRRVQAHALDSANHLGNLALVDGSQSSLLGMLNLTGASRKRLDEREILVHIQWAQTEEIHDINLALVLFAPLVHFARAQIVWRVDVTGHPSTGHLPKVVF